MQPGRGEQWPGQAGIWAGEGMQCRGLICGPAQLWHRRLAPSSPELGSCFQEQGCYPPCCTGLGLQLGPAAHTAEQVRGTQETVSNPNHKTVVQLMRSLFVSSSLLPGAFMAPLCAAKWWGGGDSAVVLDLDRSPRHSPPAPVSSLVAAGGFLSSLAG